MRKASLRDGSQQADGRHKPGVCAYPLFAREHVFVIDLVEGFKRGLLAIEEMYNVNAVRVLSDERVDLGQQYTEFLLAWRDHAAEIDSKTNKQKSIIAGEDHGHAPAYAEEQPEKKQRGDQVGEGATTPLAKRSLSDSTPGADADSYLRGLHLQGLALARACACGYELAWQHFIDCYREPLRRAATAISKSSSIGEEELADSLYAELFGLKDPNGERRSPLASYSGCAALSWDGFCNNAGTTICRPFSPNPPGGIPLEEGEFATTKDAESAPDDVTCLRLESTIQTILRDLEPEDQLLLARNFLDGRDTS